MGLTAEDRTVAADNGNSEETDTRLFARATPVFAAEQVDGWTPAMIDAPATVITPIEQAEAFVAATEGVQSRFLVEKLQGFGDDVKTDGDNDAGEGQRERVLVAGQVMGETGAEQSPEGAADHEQPGEFPVDQAGPGIARRRRQPEGGYGY
jgi:hypothetical protein